MMCRLSRQCLPFCYSIPHLFENPLVNFKQLTRCETAFRFPRSHCIVLVSKKRISFEYHPTKSCLFLKNSSQSFSGFKQNRSKSSLFEYEIKRVNIGRQTRRRKNFSCFMVDLATRVARFYCFELVIRSFNYL